VSQIVRVEVGRFYYNFQGEFKFFKQDADGNVRRPSVLVRLMDDDGFHGWGQAVPVPTWTYETVETVESTLKYYLAEALLGTDPADMVEIHRRMEYAIRPGFTIGQPLCKSAVDLACYDLTGKRSSKTVSQLLGDAKEEALTLSWTVNSMDMAVVESQLEEGKARGYRNYNIKVGPPQSPDYDLELASKVYAFAPQGFLWADANTGYSLDAALEVLPRLADAGAAVIESPLPPSQIRGYQALKKQGALPIYMDEGIISANETAEFIALDMMDGITIKHARSSGLWHAQKIIQLAQKHGLPVLGSGLTDPDLSLAAAVHLFAWAGIAHPCALNGPQYLVDSLCTDRLRPEKDIVRVPDQPGLGLVMDPCAADILEIVADKSI
jgi:L-alanine-DL-glutamate epimerase-like enolase superfamily enzyme